MHVRSYTTPVMQAVKCQVWHYQGIIDLRRHLHVVAHHTAVWWATTCKCRLWTKMMVKVNYMMVFVGICHWRALTSFSFRLRRPASCGRLSEDINPHHHPHPSLWNNKEDCWPSRRSLCSISYISAVDWGAGGANDLPLCINRIHRVGA